MRITYHDRLNYHGKSLFTLALLYCYALDLPSKISFVIFLHTVFSKFQYSLLIYSCVRSYFDRITLVNLQRSCMLLTNEQTNHNSLGVWHNIPHKAKLPGLLTLIGVVHHPFDHGMMFSSLGVGTYFSESSSILIVFSMSRISHNELFLCNMYREQPKNGWPFVR